MRRILLVLGALCAVVAAEQIRGTLAPRHAAAMTAEVPTASAERAARLRDIDIAFWARRATEDPLGAEDRVQLAALLLERARATGSYGDVLRADTVVREAIHIRPARNEKGRVLLASALMAQHRFLDAYAVARQVDSLVPDVPNYVALRGEVALELGRYDEARRCFDRVRALGGSIEGSVAARLARYEEVTGSATMARARIDAAARAARESAMPAEQRAWFEWRLADFDLRHGRIDDAEATLKRALEASPADHRLLSAMSRLAWQRGEWRASAEYGERATAITLDPATLGILSDDYAALGDTARAATLADAMRAAVMAQTGPLHRAWSLFLLDHGRDAHGVLARAREEARVRRDVYGADVEAWALHALGRDREAWAKAEEALAQGTEDASLEYHAGVIAQSLGEATAARAHLKRALALNPWFHPRQAPDARARLARFEYRDAGERSRHPRGSGDPPG